MNFLNCKMGSIAILSCLSLGSCADKMIASQMADLLTSAWETGQVHYKNSVPGCQALAYVILSVILKIVTVITPYVHWRKMGLREVK